MDRKALLDRLPQKWRRGLTLSRLGGWLLGLFRACLLIGICFVILWPVIWMLHYTFIELQDTRDLSIVYLPKHVTLDNLKTAFRYLQYPVSLLNTVFLVCTVSLLQLFSCNLMGYGLARFRFRGARLLLLLVVFVLIVPPQTIMVPIYLHYRSLDLFGLMTAIKGTGGILDTYLPFWMQAATGFGIKNSLYILIFMQIYKGASREIEEAAMVDGAGVWKTYARIMLPNARAGMVTVFLFSFVWQWNDSYYVSMFLNNTKVLANQLATLSETIAVYAGSVNTDKMQVLIYNNAGTFLCVLPLVVLYLILQKQFVESVERTGIVG